MRNIRCRFGYVEDMRLLERVVVRVKRCADTAWLL